MYEKLFFVYSLGKTEMIDITLPLPKIKQKGKMNNLSFNVYRNAYYRDLGKAKKEYSEIVKLLLSKHRRKQYNKIKITFTLYCKTKKRRDLTNFCAVVDKFASDTLVDMNIINDDDCKHIPEITYKFGGYGEDAVVVRVEEVA